MKMQRVVQLPYGVEETRKHVYRYLQANGLYPVDKEWTRFYAYAMRRDIGDPRRFRLDVLLSYRPNTEGTELKIVYFFRHKYAIEKLFGSIRLTKTDKEFYRGYLDHFAQSLRNQTAEHFESALDDIAYSPKSDVMYVFAIIALPVLVFAALNSWDQALWYVWSAVFIMLMGWVTFIYIRNRKRSMK